jgi:hypothetical protein
MLIAIMFSDIRFGFDKDVSAKNEFMRKNGGMGEMTFFFNLGD